MYIRNIVVAVETAPLKRFIRLKLSSIEMEQCKKYREVIGKAHVTALMASDIAESHRMEKEKRQLVEKGMENEEERGHKRWKFIEDDSDEGFE